MRHILGVSHRDFIERIMLWAGFLREFEQDLKQDAIEISVLCLVCSAVVFKECSGCTPWLTSGCNLFLRLIEQEINSFFKLFYCLL